MPVMNEAHNVLGAGGMLLLVILPVPLLPARMPTSHAIVFSPCLYLATQPFDYPSIFVDLAGIVGYLFPCCF